MSVLMERGKRKEGLLTICVNDRRVTAGTLLFNIKFAIEKSKPLARGPTTYLGSFHMIVIMISEYIPIQTLMLM